MKRSWKELLQEAIELIDKAQDDDNMNDEKYAKCRSLITELEYMIEN